MCCAGRKTRGVKTFEQLTGICDALVIVEAAVVESSCMPCDANPYNRNNTNGDLELGALFNVYLHM